MNSVKTTKLSGGSSHISPDATLDGIKGWSGGKCISASYSTVVWGASDNIEAPSGASIVEVDSGSPEFFATYVVYYCKLAQALELEQHYRECCERGIKIKRGETSPQQFGECKAPPSFCKHPLPSYQYSMGTFERYIKWEPSAPTFKRYRDSLEAYGEGGCVCTQEAFIRPGISRAQLSCE